MSTIITFSRDQAHEQLARAYANAISEAVRGERMARRLSAPTQVPHRAGNTPTIGGDVLTHLDDLRLRAGYAGEARARTYATVLDRATVSAGRQLEQLEARAIRHRSGRPHLYLVDLPAVRLVHGVGDAQVAELIPVRRVELDLLAHRDAYTAITEGWLRWDETRGEHAISEVQPYTWDAARTQYRASRRLPRHAVAAWRELAMSVLPTCDEHAA